MLINITEPRTEVQRNTGTESRFKNAEGYTGNKKTSLIEGRGLQDVRQYTE